MRAGGAADVLLLLVWIVSVGHLIQVVLPTADSFYGPDQSGECGAAQSCDLPRNPGQRPIRHEVAESECPSSAEHSKTKGHTRDCDEADKPQFPLGQLCNTFQLLLASEALRSFLDQGG